MYPIMLPGNNTESNGFTSFRNPDGLFPKQQGTPPDRLGVLFVRLLEALEDGWNDLRRGRRHSTPGPIQEDSAASGDAAFQTD